MQSQSKSRLAQTDWQADGPIGLTGSHCARFHVTTVSTSAEYSVVTRWSPPVALLVAQTLADREGSPGRDVPRLGWVANR